MSRAELYICSGELTSSAQLWICQIRSGLGTLFTGTGFFPELKIHTGKQVGKF